MTRHPSLSIPKRDPKRARTFTEALPATELHLIVGVRGYDAWPNLVGNYLTITGSMIPDADGQWTITAQDGPLCTLERDGLTGTLRLEL